MAGGHHRVGEHRHRPDDQNHARRRTPDRGSYGRHRPRLRRTGPRRPHGGPDHRPWSRRAVCDAGLPRHQTRFRRDRCERTPRQLGPTCRHRRADARPHYGRDRAVLRAGGCTPAFCGTPKSLPNATTSTRGPSSRKPDVAAWLAARKTCSSTLPSIWWVRATMTESPQDRADAELLADVLLAAVEEDLRLPKQDVSAPDAMTTAAFPALDVPRCG
jgi:hypothetical protein